MIENKKIPKKPLNKTDQVLLHDNPTKAAHDLDAIFYFIHKRYSESGKDSVPDLRSFLITRAEVVFSDKAKYVTLLKKPDRRVLQILAPPTEPHQEELRRIYLLNEFGDLIIKYQKQAYLQIREMLLSITEPEGREVLIQEFEDYKSALNLKHPKVGK